MHLHDREHARQRQLDLVEEAQHLARLELGAQQRADGERAFGLAAGVARRRARPRACRRRAPSCPSRAASRATRWSRRGAARTATRRRALRWDRAGTRRSADRTRRRRCARRSAARSTIASLSAVDVLARLPGGEHERQDVERLVRVELRAARRGSGGRAARTPSGAPATPAPGRAAPRRAATTAATRSTRAPAPSSLVRNSSEASARSSRLVGDDDRRRLADGDLRAAARRSAASRVADARRGSPRRRRAARCRASSTSSVGGLCAIGLSRSSRRTNSSSRRSVSTFAMSGSRRRSASSSIGTGHVLVERHQLPRQPHRLDVRLDLLGRRSWRRAAPAAFAISSACAIRFSTEP